MFGSSQYINSDQLTATLERKLHHLLKSREHTLYEKANNIDQNIIFLAWDSTLEEDTLARLGLDWFSRPNIQLLDLRRHHLIDKQRSCHYALGLLRLRYRDNRPMRIGDAQKGGHDLVHNAANDTVFQMQILLALEYMDETLKTKFRFGQRLVKGTDSLEWLPFPWSGRTFDQVNNPEGVSAKPHISNYYLHARTDAQMKDNTATGGESEHNVAILIIPTPTRAAECLPVAGTA